LVGRKAEALSYSGELVASSLEVVNSISNDIIDGGGIGLVVQSNEVVDLLGDSSIIQLVRGLWSSTSRVLVVKVPEEDVLTTDLCSLEDEVVVVAIRRAHVSGVSASDSHNGLFSAPHLVVDLIPAKGGQVQVPPGMRADEMTFIVSILDVVPHILVVDAAPIVAINEEGCFHTLAAKNVDEIVSEYIRAVVESQGNCFGSLAARINVGATSTNGTIVLGSSGLSDWLSNGGGQCADSSEGEGKERQGEHLQ